MAIPLSELINVLHIAEVRHGPLTFQQYESLREIARKMETGLPSSPDEVQSCTSLCWLALTDLFLKAQLTVIRKPDSRRWIVRDPDSGKEADLDWQATFNAATSILKRLDVEIETENIVAFLRGVATWADDPRFETINDEYDRLIGREPT